MNVGAQLPTGEVLSFPEGTSQDVVDRAVKRRLGLPVPLTAEEVEQALGTARNQVLMSLVRSIEQSNALLAKLCKDQYATQQLLNGVAQRIGALDQTVQQAAQRVEAAVLAPAVQTVERGEDGRIAATVIKKERA